MEQWESEKHGKLWLEEGGLRQNLSLFLDDDDEDDDGDGEEQAEQHQGEVHSRCKQVRGTVILGGWGTGLL